LLVAISEFFEIDALKMVSSPFEELLPDLADPERFKRVEAKINRARHGGLRPA